MGGGECRSKREDKEGLRGVGIGHVTSKMGWQLILIFFFLFLGSVKWVEFGLMAPGPSSLFQHFLFIFPRF